MNEIPTKLFTNYFIILIGTYFFYRKSFNANRPRPL